jgi:hypothetical protein
MLDALQGKHLLAEVFVEPPQNFLPSPFRKRLLVECYPPCLGVTGGDHVSRPAMENMIYTMMMMINMSTYGSPTTPLDFPPNCINQGSSHSSNPEYGAW